MTPSLYPLFLCMHDRDCVVIGGNQSAESKIRDLLDAGAEIRVIAPAVTEHIAAWSQAGRLQWEARPYKSGDLSDAFLVVSVADAETNAKVFEEAESRRTFCNAVDDVAHCNCYGSAVVRRGPLQIAISTAGQSPALAQRLRRELEVRFGAEYAPWTRRLGELRSRLFQNKEIDSRTRRTILHAQASPSAFDAFQSSPNQERTGQSSVENSDGCVKSP
jgi:precorrin-2 dehydrogenase / sirohydrochlorin ferrochelatase